MTSKLRLLISTLSLLTLLAVAIPTVSAQTLPDAPATDGGSYELPDAAGSASEDPEAEAENQTTNTDSQLPNQEFLTGLGAGVALGIIVGGIAVWFLKK